MSEQAWVLSIDDTECIWYQGVFTSERLANDAKAELEKRVDGIAIQITPLPLNPVLEPAGDRRLFTGREDDPDHRFRFGIEDIDPEDYATGHGAIWAIVTAPDYHGDPLILAATAMTRSDDDG